MWIQGAGEGTCPLRGGGTKEGSARGGIRGRSGRAGGRRRRGAVGEGAEQGLGRGGLDEVHVEPRLEGALLVGVTAKAADGDQARARRVTLGGAHGEGH